MDRITIKTLRKMVDNLNVSLGLPTEVWTPRADGRGSQAYVGCYVLDCAYGGYRLSQIVSGSGGERDITGRCGARECAALIGAYSAGLHTNREYQTP